MFPVMEQNLSPPRATPRSWDWLLILPAAWIERHASLPWAWLPESIRQTGSIVDLNGLGTLTLVLWNIALVALWRSLDLAPFSPLSRIPWALRAFTGWAIAALLWQSSGESLWSFSGFQSFSWIISIALFWAIVLLRWNKPRWDLWWVVAVCATPHLSLDRLILVLAFLKKPKQR